MERICQILGGMSSSGAGLDLGGVREAGGRRVM